MTMPTVPAPAPLHPDGAPAHGPSTAARPSNAHAATASMHRLSAQSASLVGSEILRIAGEIRALVAEGRTVCNLTVGDFSPAEFRIPEFLQQRIQAALDRGETNYPPSSGLLPLRQAIAEFYQRELSLEYPVESVLVTGGSRPAIYGAYLTLVDPGDRVVYPVPSWNNNHYCHLSRAVGVPVVCGPETAFLPTADQIRRVARNARLIALNSPLNPAGTCFDAEQLAGICDVVLEENARRRGRERPLYLLYDQVYWMLTFGGARHVDPVSLRPEMRNYTVYVDGISKAFAATGVRVGWAMGPDDIIASMGSFTGHVGAWAPRAEQVATSELLRAPQEIASYHTGMRQEVEARLRALADVFGALQQEGFPVRALAPAAAIYLSVRIALNGRRTRSGALLSTNDDIRRYLLREAGLAVVPFQAFGSVEDSGWFRLSVGAVSLREIESAAPRLRAALEGVG